MSNQGHLGPRSNSQIDRGFQSNSITIATCSRDLGGGGRGLHRAARLHRAVISVQLYGRSLLPRFYQRARFTSSDTLHLCILPLLLQHKCFFFIFNCLINNKIKSASGIIQRFTNTPVARGETAWKIVFLRNSRNYFHRSHSAISTLLN